ncbi:unnamed protein product [Hydatigera taeniaeformis]|uniref:Dynein regulatory complex protein 10 n=1 Tax=Hydatigena taeniaeformis TaxID=6205 RepID=A0A0R3WSX2_HYDTA|nr:unnamed protein product [Hydatigera taeniaeformis]
MEALDTRIRTLRRAFEELEEEFTDSIFKINSKGVEDYEEAIKQSEIRQEHLKALLTLTKERACDEIKTVRKEVKSTWSRKYKLEGVMESQIASYDEEMTALQGKYDELKKAFDSEKEQMDNYQTKMAALWVDHEEMLTQKEAERERKRAADTRDAAVTEACKVIETYARAFLARRAAAAPATSRRRRREER